MHTYALVQYLKGLSENNNKAWFVMNKPSYDILREEFTVLIGEVIAAIGKFDPAVRLVAPKDALFRIYRDVRFSHDKTPYKTTFSAAISCEGKKRHTPMYYFQINADGMLRVAAGSYMPEKEMLAAIRRSIVADFPAFKKVARAPKLVKAFGGLNDSEALARPPKGYAAGEPYSDFVRLKSFYVGAGIPAEPIPADKLASSVAELARPAVGLVQWLRTVSPEY